VKLFFTGAKFLDGRIRVDIFHTEPEADANYELLRGLGDPKARTVRGSGEEGDDEAGLRSRVEEYLRRTNRKENGNWALTP